MDRRTVLTSLGAAAAGAAALAAAWRGHGQDDALPASYWAEHFPNFVLRTQDDEPVRFYDDLVRGKLVVISFMYIYCGDGRCPIQTANLVQVRRLLGDRAGRDIFFYSVTLDPVRDTPRALKDYAAHFGARWPFLTGKPEEIEVLRRRLGFYDPDPELDRNPATHASMIRYGNDRMNWWASCPGLVRPELIVRRILRVEERPGALQA